MRCLHKTCPMGNRHCPAINECPEAKKTITIGLPARCFSTMTNSLNLSPAELRALAFTLHRLLTEADGQEYWPKHAAGELHQVAL